MLFCGIRRILFPTDHFRFLFYRKKSQALTVPPMSRLTCSAPTKSNSYLANALDAVASEPNLYRLLTFHVPKMMSFFHCWGRTKVSARVRGLCECFVTWCFWRWGFVTPRSTPKLDRQPVSDVHHFLFIIFAATLHIGGRSSSLPQPEDRPCRGDQDPLIMGRLDWWHKSRVLDWRLQSMSFTVFFLETPVWDNS
jgi:hypothetical protein